MTRFQKISMIVGMLLFTGFLFAQTVASEVENARYAELAEIICVLLIGLLLMANGLAMFKGKAKGDGNE